MIRWAPYAVLAILLIAIQQSPLGDEAEDRLDLPTLFKARDLLGKNPKVSPELKIYAFDDRAARTIGRERLNSKDWARILDSISRDKPEKIIINKSFSSTTFSTDWRQNQINLNLHKVPVYVGSYFKESRPKKFVPQRDNRREFKVETYQKPSKGTPQSPSWIKNRLYPSIHTAPPSFLTQITGVGHFNHISKNTITPFLKKGPTQVVPHLTLYAANDIRISKAQLILDGVPVPLNSNDDFLLNYLPLMSFLPQTHSLSGILKKSDKIPRPRTRGRTIIIFDKILTGTGRFVTTPLGLVPNDFLLAIAANGILTKNYLTPIQWPWMLTILLIALGASLGRLAGPAAFASVSVLGPFIIVATFILGFSYFNIVGSWLWPSFGFLVALAWAFFTKLKDQKEDLKNRLLITETEAKIIDSTLKISHPSPELSNQLDNIPEIDLAYHYSPAEVNGGDWLGVHHNPETNRFYVLLGDVAGHGVESALVTLAASGAAKGIFSTIDHFNPPRSIREDLSMIRQAVNAPLHDMSHTINKHMTMCFIGIDLNTGEVTYLNAGHVPIITIKSEGNRSMLARGSLLGYFQNFEDFNFKTFQMNPGDGCLVYTDGLTENHGPERKQIKHRVLSKIAKPELSSEEIRQEILSKIKETWQQIPPADDCAFVVMKYRPKSKMGKAI